MVLSVERLLGQESGFSLAEQFYRTAHLELAAIARHCYGQQLAPARMNSRQMVDLHLRIAVADVEKDHLREVPVGEYFAFAP